MADSEAEVKTTVEGEKTEAETATAAPLDPVVEEVAETAKAVVEDVKQSSGEVEKLVVESHLPVSVKGLESAAESLVKGNENLLQTSDGSVGESSEEVKASVTSEVQKAVDKLVADSSTSLKNLESAAKSWIKGSVDLLTPSHKETPDDAVEPTASDGTTRDRDIQKPSAAVTGERRASWTNCCGLLDLLAPNH